ncbi:TPA: prophage tail fiber N-terminal domain-containing protein [Serratia marcescens]
MIQISGNYYDPVGQPVENLRITIAAKRTTADTFRELLVSQVTGPDGEYSFELVPGYYRVTVLYPEANRTTVIGDMELESNSPPGSLNDYVRFADPVLADPTVYAEMKRWYGITSSMSEGASEAAKIAIQAKDIAVTESESAKDSAGEAIKGAEIAKDSAERAHKSSTDSNDAAERAEESAQIALSVADAYTDEVEAQKAVNDGKETRQFFYVRSRSTTELALEYTVSNGRVVPTGRYTIAGNAVNEALSEMKSRVSTVPNAPAGVDEIIAAGVEFADGHFAPLMLDDGRHAFIDANGMLRVVAADSDVVVRPYIEAQPYTLPDGAVCTKIIVDPYKNITEAWTEDGGYYFSTPDGLKRVGDLKPAAQQIKQATAASDLVMNYGATRISVSDDLRPVMYILPTFGQSLAEGWSTYADDVLIATTQLYPENAWMFKSDRGAGKENPNRGPNPIDEIVSLKDTVNGNWKETSCSSSASHIISEVEKMTGKRIHILRYVAAQGSMAYRNLTKGTYAWSVLIQGLIDAKRICERMGFKPIVLGVDVKAGESDIDKTGGIFADLYTRFLKNFDRNINSEVKRIFGGDHPAVSIFVEQCSWWPFTEWDIKNVRQGQLSADGHGNIRFTGPGYQYPHVGDIIHINSKGQNQRGVSLARAVVFECFGTGFIPVKPMEVYWSGANTIDIICSSSVEIIKDTSDLIVSSIGLGPGAGFGIRARDDSTISIISAAPFGKIGIRLTVENPTNTRSVQISYAQRRTGNDNQSGPVYGARGLFRTKSGITNLYTGEIEYQWLPAFIWELN